MELSQNTRNRKKSIVINSIERFSISQKSQENFKSEDDDQDNREKYKRRKSKLSARAFSSLCHLQDDVVGDVLDTPPSQSRQSTFEDLRRPSDNIGVLSLYCDYVKQENLSAIEASAFSVILREAANSLEVLKRTLVVTKPPPNNERKRRVMRRINKCSVDDEKAMFFGEDGGFDDVVHTVNEKLMLNRDLAFNVFNKVACELESSNSYDWLRIEVSSIIDNEEREHNLQANLKIWSELADKLRNTQRTIEEEFQMQKKKIINDVSELAANIDSSYCDNNDKLDYIQRWEASKLEQQNLRQWIEEEALLNEIKLLETNRKKHLKVSRELQLYGLQTIDTTEEEITAWTQRYNDELERRTQEINDLESKIEETNEYIEQQLELQKQRQELIDEYMGDQLKMQAEADYWNEVHRSAALIQAHWRGYMVRHELGQYEGILKRPKRRKRKGKKKKK